MHKTMKRFVAALTGLAMAVAPVTAWADEAAGCPLYVQVQSNATGGEFVAGLLVDTATRETTTTTTTFFSGSAEVTGTVTVTSNNANGSLGTSYTRTVVTVSNETNNIGYYKMNDGSSWEVNCTTGDATKR